MTDPALAGKMLVETLAAALSVHLVRQYSNLAPASISLPSARGALDPRSLRRVTDFIESKLGEDLTIEALAKEVRIPTIPITRSGKTITDSRGFRSPWRRAEVHRGAGVGLRV